MNKIITITGTATCTACMVSGSDADGCRANLLSNGLIYCILCGGYSSPLDRNVTKVLGMPLPIRSFAAAMLRQKDVHAPALKLTMATFGPDGSSSQAAFACAQGNEGVILNHGALIFSADSYGFSKLAVNFQADLLQDIPVDFEHTPSRGIDQHAQELLSSLKRHRCPAALEAAIGKLISIGFTVRLTDLGRTSMSRIQLHCGGNIAGTNVPKGIMVEATYLLE